MCAFEQKPSDIGAALLEFSPLVRKRDSRGRKPLLQITADVKVLGFIYVNYNETKEDSVVKLSGEPNLFPNTDAHTTTDCCIMAAGKLPATNTPNDSDL